MIGAIIDFFYVKPCKDSVRAFDQQPLTNIFQTTRTWLGITPLFGDWDFADTYDIVRWNFHGKVGNREKKGSRLCRKTSPSLMVRTLSGPSKWTGWSRIYRDIVAFPASIGRMGEVAALYLRCFNAIRDLLVSGEWGADTMGGTDM